MQIWLFLSIWGVLLWVFMAVSISYKFGGSFVGIFVESDALLRVWIRAPDCWKLPLYHLPVLATATGLGPYCNQECYSRCLQSWRERAPPIPLPATWEAPQLRSKRKRTSSGREA